MGAYVYKLDGVNYINLTNRCTNDCVFCIRKNYDGVGGFNLMLEKEPTAREVIDLLKEDKTDIVFCGMGEPTLKIEELKEIARYAKSYGGNVRLNTNGHADLYHNRNVAAELEGIVDEASISLNQADAGAYDALVRSRYGKDAYFHMLKFAEDCVRHGIKVTLTVVDLISESEIKKARKIARKIGADFRVRACVY